MRPTGNFSKEGHQWTPKGGLSQGLPSICVIRPDSKGPLHKVHDVIVIGAGYHIAS